MGVVTSRAEMSQSQPGESAVGFHRSWYPVCLAAELNGEAIVGQQFLGTRVVAYRADDGQPVVQSAWCPHLGADLSIGKIVEGRLRCPYHHWSFDTGGTCTHIPSGDKIPSAARIFTYPSAEAWGLIWAFNGEKADFGVPRVPGAEEGTIAYEASRRGERSWDTWIAVSNGVDFQHLRTLHGMPVSSMPESLDVEVGGIEFKVESPYHLQHGRITGTNTFAQHLRLGSQDMFQLFTGAPLGPRKSTGFVVVGVPNGEEARLRDVRAMVDRLNEEDAPVLSTMRFKRGLLTASDRHLAHYLRYVDAFPCFVPPA